MTFQTITCAELAAMEFPPVAPEPATPPTWRELLAAEPRLRDAEAEAGRCYRRHRGDPWAWSAIKAMFLPLVGWEAARYELRHSSAYDAAYDHLLKIFEEGTPR